jgi:hypothetical protein
MKETELCDPRSCQVDEWKKQSRAVNQTLFLDIYISRIFEILALIQNGRTVTGAVLLTIPKFVKERDKGRDEVASD